MQICGEDFLSRNESLQELNLPNLRKCGSNFLSHNESLQELNLPNLQECGEDFLSRNESLQELNLPNLRKCGRYFLSSNEKNRKQEKGNDYMKQKKHWYNFLKKMLRSNRGGIKR